MDLNLFEKEWSKLPYYSKIYSFFGVLLIFLSWIIDHWGNSIEGIYTFWGFDIRRISFNLGLSILFLIIIYIFYKHLGELEKIIKFRKKYPFNNLNKDFYLVWSADQKLILFDKKTNKYHHIASWQTALDLNFTNYGFSNLGKIDLGMPYKFKFDTNSEEIEYKDGGPILIRH